MPISRRSWDLTKHKEQHNGSYKFKCEGEENGVTWGCGKGFHKKGDLNRHLRRANAEQCKRARPEKESSTIKVSVQVIDAISTNASQALESSVMGPDGRELKPLLMQDLPQAVPVDNLRNGCLTSDNPEELPVKTRKTNVREMKKPTQQQQMLTKIETFSSSSLEVIKLEDSNCEEPVPLQQTQGAAGVLSSINNNIPGRSSDNLVALASDPWSSLDWEAGINPSIPGCSRILIPKKEAIEPCIVIEASGNPENYTSLWQRTREILIVDDDPTCIKTFAEFFCSFQCSIDIAFTGTEALNKLLRRQRTMYDLTLINTAILDILGTSKLIGILRDDILLDDRHDFKNVDIEPKDFCNTNYRYEACCFSSGTHALPSRHHS